MRTIPRVRATIKQVSDIDWLLTNKATWSKLSDKSRKSLRRVWARLQVKTSAWINDGAR